MRHRSRGAGGQPVGAWRRSQCVRRPNKRISQIFVGCGRAVVGEQFASPSDVPKTLIGWVSTEVRRGLGSAGPAMSRKAIGETRLPRARLFTAQIDGDPACWLRTGDLAFLDDAGELYITGRIKELVIIRGIDRYPQDIERTVQNVDPALRKNGGAAFSVSERDRRRNARGRPGGGARCTGAASASPAWSGGSAKP